LRFEIVEGRSLETDESRRCEGGHAASDLELRKKVEGKRPEDPEQISIVNRGGSRRTADLIRKAKVPKWEQNR